MKSGSRRGANVRKQPLVKNVNRELEGAIAFDQFLQLERGNQHLKGNPISVTDLAVHSMPAPANSLATI